MIPSYKLNTFFNLLLRYNRITPHQYRVYTTLLSFRGREGRCYPSHAILADAAGVSERCVRDALREARYRRWIDWTNERVGRRQTSNRYSFVVSLKKVMVVLSSLPKLKKKTAETTSFFRRQQLPGSPYYFIKKKKEYLWKEINETKETLSSWQKLKQDNPELASAHIKTLYGI